MANPGKAHHQGRSHPLLHGEPAGLFRGLPGAGEGVESAGRPGAAGFPVPCGVRFGADDLRSVRRVTARWAVRAALPAARAEDFVIAVSEIAANAVRYGSPTARLLRVAGGAATAEVRDSGCWRPAAGPASANGRSGGRGLALARRVCDEVGIRAGAGGTTVLLRMHLPARGGRAAVTGPGAVVLPAPCAAALSPGRPGRTGRQAAGAGRMDGRRIGA
jgi:serine/threonine-protein kinase RsbW